MILNENQEKLAARYVDMEKSLKFKEVKFAKKTIYSLYLVNNTQITKGAIKYFL